MLTVVTQNSRLPRRSVLSGDRMAFGFGYPHCSVPDARCQVSPGFLANRLLAHVKSSRSVNRFRILHRRLTTSIEYVSRAGKLRTLAVVFRDPDSPLEEFRKASRGTRAMPQIVPEPERCPRLRAFPWSRVRKAVRSRQEARRLPPARRDERPCRLLCSVDYQHQHIDMITRGAPSSSRSNDP